MLNQSITTAVERVDDSLHSVTVRAQRPPPHVTQAAVVVIPVRMAVLTPSSSIIPRPSPSPSPVARRAGPSRPDPSVVDRLVTRSDYTGRRWRLLAVRRYE